MSTDEKKTPPFRWVDRNGRPIYFSAHACVPTQDELLAGLKSLMSPLRDADMDRTPGGDPDHTPDDGGGLTAPDVLRAAAAHMDERAKTYDAPGGERSMGRAVAAWCALTGKQMTEAEGWLLMQCVKDARLFQRAAFHRDSAEDCTAYAALKAEAKAREGEK